MRSARARLTAVAVVPLLFLAAACSDDKKDDTGAKSPSGGGTSIGTGTTSGAGGGTPGASGAPGASGGSGATGAPGQPGSSGSPSPGGSKSSEQNASSGRSLSAAELKAATVVGSDLPSGWTVAGPTVEDPDATRADKAVCQPLLDLLNGGGTLQTTGLVSAELTAPGASSSEYALSLASFGPEAAAKLLSDTKSAIGSCATFKAGDSSGPMLTYTVAKAQGPNIGDDSVTFVVSSDLGFTVRLTAARTGAVIVQGMALGSDKAMPEAIVKAQVDKAKAAQQR